MKKLHLIIFTLLTSLIVSCGFHLRGSQDLSTVLPEVQVTGVNQHSELGRELLRALEASKVNVLDQSDTILNITQNSISKRVLSVDSAGRANQYELSYQLNFALVKKIKNEQKDKPTELVDIIKPQGISEKRSYLFDANLVLAKADEESQLNNDMRQAAILQLLRRLKFSLESKQKSKTQ